MVPLFADPGTTPEVVLDLIFMNHFSIPAYHRGESWSRAREVQAGYARGAN